MPRGNVPLLHESGGTVTTQKVEMHALRVDAQACAASMQSLVDANYELPRLTSLKLEEYRFVLRIDDTLNRTPPTGMICSDSSSGFGNS
jgi:hypothetical protein